MKFKIMTYILLFLISSRMYASFDEVNLPLYNKEMTNFFTVINNRPDEISNKRKIANLITALIISDDARNMISTAISTNLNTRYRSSKNSVFFNKIENYIEEEGHKYFQNEFYSGIENIINGEIIEENTDHEKFQRYFNHWYLKVSEKWRNYSTSLIKDGYKNLFLHVSSDDIHNEIIQGKFKYTNNHFEQTTFKMMFNYLSQIMQIQLIKFSLSAEYQELENYIYNQLDQMNLLNEEQLKYIFKWVQNSSVSYNYDSNYSIKGIMFLNLMMTKNKFNYYQ